MNAENPLTISVETQCFPRERSVGQASPLAHTLFHFKFLVWSWGEPPGLLEIHPKPLWSLA